MNHHEKFHATSFILGKEILNRTDTHTKLQKNKQVQQWALTYIHTCRPTSTHSAIFHKRHISSMTFIVGLPIVNLLYFPVDGQFASGGAKFPKMGDSLPRTLVNHHAKFDTASFIVGGEICTVQTHTHTHTKSKQYIETFPTTTLFIGMSITSKQ